MSNMNYCNEGTTSGVAQMKCNGRIELLACYRVVTDLRSQLIMKVNFHINGIDQPISTEIPVKDLEVNSIRKHIPDDFILYGGEMKDKCKYVIKVLERARENVAIVEVKTVPQGYLRLDNSTYIYMLGTTVIGLHDKMLLKTDSQLRIKYPEYKAKRVVQLKWIADFFTLSPVHPALFLSALIPYTHIILENAGCKDYFVTYVYGETGKGKTSYVKLLTDIYQDSDNCMSLSSGKADIRRIISQFKDTVFLIDDFNRTASERVRKSKMATLSEIIQQVSGGGWVEEKGIRSQITSMVFVTAEEILNNPSTINRCLMIPIDGVMDRSRLTRLQEEQSQYVSFLVGYIQFICCNYSKLCELVKTTNFILHTDEIVEDSYAGASRVCRTEAQLRMVETIFMHYIRKFFCIGKEAQEVLKQKMELSIKRCISETLECIKKENSKDGMSYVEKIVSWCSSDELVAESYEEYLKSRRKKKENLVKQAAVKYFFRDEDYICVSGNNLLLLFNQLEEFQYKISKKAISQQLENHGLLKRMGGELSYPIRKNFNNSVSKKRYYHIHMNVIQEYMSPGDKILANTSKIWEDYYPIVY